MVIDELSRSERYEALADGLAEAFQFLRRADLAELTEGRHDIDGDRLYALIVRGEGKPHAEAKLEIHRRYIDVQYSIQGTDEIGWSPLSACSTPTAPFDEAQDAGLYTDPPAAWFDLPPATFTILFPADAHAPMAGPGLLHKAVVKVRCPQTARP